MEVIETTKGNPSLLYKGYAYRKRSQRRDGVVNWVCLKERTTKCKGKLISKGEKIWEVIHHHCGAPEDAAQLEVRKCVFQAKKRAREEDTPIAKVCSEEIQDLFNKGYESVTEMVNQRTLKKCLYRHRSQSQGKQKQPKRHGVLFDGET